MELIINKVEKGAEYEGRIFDFWIKVETQNGNYLKIFDSFTFDLRGKESTKINALLLAGFIDSENGKNDNLQKLNGKIVAEVKLNQCIWTKKRNDIFVKKWVGIENNDGLYLLSPIELEEKGIKIGQYIELNVGRIDLVAIE